MGRTLPKLSGLAVLSLFISLTLCYFMISSTIKSRLHINDMYIEQHVLEKTLQINSILSKLLYKAEALSTMVIQGHGNIDDFDRVAPSLIDDPAILNVLLAPDGYVAKVYPPEGNEGLLGFYFFDDNPGNEEARVARDSSHLVFGGPFPVHQGDGMILVGRMPVYIDTPEDTRKFWGLVSVALKSSQTLEYAELDFFDEQNLSYELWRISPDTGEKQIIANNIDKIRPGSRFIEKKVEIMDAVWYFEVSSPNEWYDYPENLILLVAGFLGSFLVMFIVQNNSDLKNMKSTLEVMTKTDALTGIYNRRYMEEKLGVIVKAAHQSSGTLSLLMIDVDFFKNYNDTYGHEKGDVCLKNITEILNNNLLRTDDFTARYGGEEFVVVLPNTNEYGARTISERLLECVRESRIPHEKSDVAPYVTISIGATTGKVENAVNGNDFVRLADKALYRSKQTGRDKYTFITFGEEV